MPLSLRVTTYRRFLPKGDCARNVFLAAAPGVEKVAQVVLCDGDSRRSDLRPVFARESKVLGDICLNTQVVLGLHVRCGTGRQQQSGKSGRDSEVHLSE